AAPAPATQTALMQDVLVASVDLRSRQALNNETMRWHPWPEEALNPVYITRSARPDALEALVGSIVCYRMSFGEPIREANLAPHEVGFSAANCPAQDTGSIGVPAN